MKLLTFLEFFRVGLGDLLDVPVLLLAATSVSPSDPDPASLIFNFGGVLVFFIA